jgi:hypothetical protein
MKIKNDELRRVYDTLGKDLISIIGKTKNPSQTRRRSFIRAFVSLVEFDTYNRKQRALQLHSSGYHQFNISELILLKEIQPEIDDKGRVRERQKFIRLIDNYKFSIRMFCKAVQINFEIPVNNEGWIAFKETIELRNQITHPKNESELYITDDNLNTVIKGYEWFMTNYKMIVIESQKTNFPG